MRQKRTVVVVLIALAVVAGAMAVPVAAGGDDHHDDDDETDHDGDDGDGATNQQNQQSNDDSGVADTNVGNGNSVTVGAGSESVTVSDGGDANNEENHDEDSADGGDANQQSQQSNGDSDALDADVANGNSLALGVVSENTSSGAGGDTGNQWNENDQQGGGDGGDANQQSQQFNADADVLDLDVLNGNAGGVGILSDGTEAGPGGETGNQQNINRQGSGGDGDCSTQAQKYSAGVDVLALSLLNGNPVGLGAVTDGLDGGYGPDTGNQENHNKQRCGR